MSLLKEQAPSKKEGKFHLSKVPFSKTLLNWTGSIIPLLIFYGSMFPVSWFLGLGLSPHCWAMAWGGRPNVWGGVGKYQGMQPPV